jgi:membrane protease YdiL (CAAX protease family)
MSRQVTIKPLPLGSALLLVGVPAVVASVTIRYLVPLLVDRFDVPFLVGYMVWWIKFMALFFVMSLVAYWLEGNALSWTAFVERYRLQKPQGKIWLWIVGFLVLHLVIALGGGMLVGTWASSVPLFAVPDAFPPELRPGGTAALVPGELMGMPLKGQWWIAGLYFLGWALNILGEEFWFRGYLLPRQEQAHGRHAWLAHGLLWGLNHLWQAWTLPVLLPSAFLWAYVAQRTKSTWFTIIAHGVGNFIPLIPITLGILGMSI